MLSDSVEFGTRAGLLYIILYYFVLFQYMTLKNRKKIHIVYWRERCRARGICFPPFMPAVCPLMDISSAKSFSSISIFFLAVEILRRIPFEVTAAVFSLAAAI